MGSNLCTRCRTGHDYSEGVCATCLQADLAAVTKERDELHASLDSDGRVRNLICDRRALAADLARAMVAEDLIEQALKVVEQVRDHAGRRKGEVQDLIDAADRYLASQGAGK